MYFQVEDRFRERDSLLHRLDPRVKLVIAVGLILTLSLLPVGAFAGYGAVWLAVLAGAAVARVGPGYVLRRSFVALPFVLAVAALPFTAPGEVIGRVPWLGWPVTLEGTLRATSIVAKSWVSVQVAILLVATTSLPDLLWGLRALRVPAPLIAIVSFMYRYLFVLAEEAQRLLRARAARSAAQAGRRSGGPLVWRGRVAGYMVGSLMLRSFERSERIYQAMAARGYRGELRSLARHAMHRRDWLALAAAACFAVILLIVGFLGSGQ